MNKPLQVLTLVATLGLSSAANAALVSRLGGQAVYDTGLNVTWIADANLAASSTFGVGGITASGSTIGSMSWDTALSWIGAMNASNYLGYNDWRLPTVKPVNGTTFNFNGGNLGYDGSVDIGYNISEPTAPYAPGNTQSEMPYLFYNSLGNKGYYFPSGTGPQPGWGLTNTGPFSHFQSGLYWSATENPFFPMFAFNFDFSNGSQFTSNKGDNLYALALRTGDVAAVPIPAAVWLFGSGLLGLIGVARRRAMRDGHK